MSNKRWYEEVSLSSLDYSINAWDEILAQGYEPTAVEVKNMEDAYDYYVKQLGG